MQSNADSWTYDTRTSSIAFLGSAQTFVGVARTSQQTRKPLHSAPSGRNDCDDRESGIGGTNGGSPPPEGREGHIAAPGSHHPLEAEATAK